MMTVWSKYSLDVIYCLPCTTFFSHLKAAHPVFSLMANSYCRGLVMSVGQSLETQPGSALIDHKGPPLWNKYIYFTLFFPPSPSHPPPAQLEKRHTSISSAHQLQPLHVSGLQSPVDSNITATDRLLLPGVYSPITAGQVSGGWYWT